MDKKIKPESANKYVDEHNARKMLRNQLLAESHIVSNESIQVLQEFEQLDDNIPL